MVVDPKLCSCLKFILLNITDRVLMTALLSLFPIVKIELPERLRTITSEDYQRTIERILEFMEAVERDVEIDLTLNSRDLNSLNQAQYERYSNLPVSQKLASTVRGLSKSDRKSFRVYRSRGKRCRS